MTKIQGTLNLEQQRNKRQTPSTIIRLLLTVVCCVRAESLLLVVISDSHCLALSLPSTHVLHS
jgi:hypothetical protein